MRSGGSPILGLVASVLLVSAGAAAQPLPGDGWVRIPGGRFQMGCVPADTACLQNESPRHAVTLSRPFDLMAREVTVAQHVAFVEVTGAPPPLPVTFPQDPDHPAVMLTWHAALAVCAWLGGRLPTEAEWERAARADHDGRIFGATDRLERAHANFGTAGCCGGAAEGADRWVHTAPVGSFAPNDFGLYDMTGNVWEWVADWHGPYPVGPVADPQGPTQGVTRVARGASWLNPPGVQRTSVRLSFSPDGRTSNVGVRCARDVPGLVPAE